MLRTLLTLLTLTLPALLAAVPALAGTGAASHDPPPPVVDTYSLDAGLLPGATGWFAVAFTVDVDSYLTVEGSFPPARRADAPSRAYVITTGEGGGHPAPVGSGSFAAPFASADALGARVACCPPPFQGEPGSGGEFQSGWYLPAGETVWIGFLAYEVDASQGEIVIRSDAGILMPYETRTGTDVQYVDLVEEAKRRALGVDLMGQRVLGGAGDVHLDWWPSGAGFFELSYHAVGDARATLSVEVPSQTVLDGEVVAEEWGHVVAMQEGRFALSLTDVEPGYQRPGLGWTGEIRAEVLYADLHLPGEALYVWHEG